MNYEGCPEPVLHAVGSLGRDLGSIAIAKSPMTTAVKSVEWHECRVGESQIKRAVTSEELADRFRMVSIENPKWLNEPLLQSPITNRKSLYHPMAR